MSDIDITVLVLGEHESFRRAFAALQDSDDLAGAWQDLANRLEVHAVAEEELFYPVLARAADDGADQGLTAVREHNDIRRALEGVDPGDVGSPAWWDAVNAVQEVNAEHMADEERDFIAEFRDGVPAERRSDLGLQWLKFHDEHEDAAGLPHELADPDAVVSADPPGPLE